jgi:hypothetical protein
MYGKFKKLMIVKLNYRFGILLAKKNIRLLRRIIIRIVMVRLFRLVLILEIRFLQFVNNITNHR